MKGEGRRDTLRYPSVEQRVRLPAKAEGAPHEETARLRFLVVQRGARPSDRRLDQAAVVASLGVRGGDRHEGVLEVENEGLDLARRGSCCQICCVVGETRQHLPFQEPDEGVDGVPPQVLDQAVFLDPAGEQLDDVPQRGRVALSPNACSASACVA